MRDISASQGALRPVRLAVYDDMGGITLGQALDRNELLDRDALQSLISARTFGS
jgi:hypothetical protein